MIFAPAVAPRGFPKPMFPIWVWTKPPGWLSRTAFPEVHSRFEIQRLDRDEPLPGRPAQGLREHVAIIDAVCSRDSDDAERAMREHLFSVAEALRRLAEFGPSPLIPTAMSR